MSTQTDAHDGVGSHWATASAGPDGHLRARESGENFPVALRVLPAALREHLRAVYDVTRTIDDLGDRAPGDRVARLATFSGQLDAVWAGHAPEDPMLRRLATTVVACGLSRQPF